MAKASKSWKSADLNLGALHRKDTCHAQLKRFQAMRLSEDNLFILIELIWSIKQFIFREADQIPQSRFKPWNAVEKDQHVSPARTLFLFLGARGNGRHIWTRLKIFYWHTCTALLCLIVCMQHIMVLPQMSTKLIMPIASCIVVKLILVNLVCKE